MIAVVRPASPPSRQLAARFFAVVVLLPAFLFGLAQGQSATATLPVRVTGLRQNRSGGESMQIDRGMALTQVTNATAMQMIERAYGLEDSQLTGGPDWVATARYDLTFAGGTLSNAGTGAALKQILAEYFHLVLDQKKKSAPIYALVVSESGKKFKDAPAQPPVEPGSPRPLSEMTIRDGRGELSLNGTPGALATLLRAEVDRPILDRTGLTGTYTIQFHWTSDGDSATLLSQELQQQLGLQLVPQEADLPFCTIEHIERPKETEPIVP